MANKELTAYVKWKSAEALENKGTIGEREERKSRLHTCMEV
jgi:hypothetical protein